MNQRRTDFELLQAFARAGNQKALADVIRRHLDLVYAIAWRKVGDAGAAEEIAQNVFTILSRKAWRFAPDDSIPAWLHRATLLESQSWVRGELRRRRREQTAVELGTTMRTSDELPAVNALVPLLDEALLSLRETDRTALLLRFYESHSLRDVGAALGVGEDAAQKRVAGAVEKLAQFFQRRGFKTATLAAATAALQHTATSASVASATLVVNAVLQTAPPALAGLTALLARLASMTKAQTTLLCVALAVVPVAWQWNNLQSAKREASQRLADVIAAEGRVENSRGEIERLRGEVTRLDRDLARASQNESKSMEGNQRLADLKQRLLSLLTAKDSYWPEDLPFVRVAKDAIENVTSHKGSLPFDASGRLSSWMVELLGLTAEEKAFIESNLSQYLQGVNQLATRRAYETNSIPTMRGVMAKTIAVPSLGLEQERLWTKFVSPIYERLGQHPRGNEFTGFWLHSLCGFASYPWTYDDMQSKRQSPQQFAFVIKPDGTESPDYQLYWLGSNLRKGKLPVREDIPPYLRERFEPWIRSLGVTGEIFATQP